MLHSSKVLRRLIAAKLLGISGGLVAHAGRVGCEDGPAVPGLRQEVEQRQVKISDAPKFIDQPAEVQQRAVARTLRGESGITAQDVR